ncbi:hypothetical protein [Bradyrhizobium sp.]
MNTQATTENRGDVATVRSNEGQDIEYFLHGQGIKPMVAVAPSDDTLRAVLIRLEIIRGEAHGFQVFIGECDEALKEPSEADDCADEHAPVDIDLTLAVLEIHRHRHVHVHRCRHVAVEVNFGKDTKRHRFSPNTTVGVATEWARRKFHLDPAVAGEFVLQVCGSLTQPRSTEHLGDLVQGTECSICFDLVKEITPKG